MTKKRKNEVEIRFIYPPFELAINPYISIPTLASYLKAHGIKVSALDLNQAFFCRLLSQENLIKGKEFAGERFVELNNKPELKFSQVYEYCNLCSLLSELGKKREEYGWLYYPFFDFSFVQKTFHKNLLLKLATAPFFPETMRTKPYFQFISDFDPFDSGDLIRCTRQNNVYTQIFKELLSPLFQKERPEIVGISVVFAYQIIPAFQCAAIIKQLAPEIHICMGGPFVSIYMREIKEEKIFEVIDSLILDEGEIPLEKLCTELSHQAPDFSKVPGLIYRNGNGIQRNPTVPPVDIDQLPPPDYTVFDLDKYLVEKNQMMVPFRLSRGCQWGKCTFCRTKLYFSEFNQQPSYELIYEKLKTVIDASDISNILFSDESTDPLLLEYISRRFLQEKRNIQWGAHTRVNKNITKERCLLYKEAGCARLTVGIESFNDRVLARMKKGISSSLIDKVLSEIDGVLPIGAYMIVGFPTETEEEAQMSYDALQQYIKKGWIEKGEYGIFSMAYGSEIWDNPGEFGITDISRGAGQDLFPDCINFKSSGMERSKAFSLFRKFSRKFSSDTVQIEEKDIVIDDVIVPLRYDTGQLIQTLSRVLELGDIHFTRLFRQWDAKMSPIRQSIRN